MTPKVRQSRANKAFPASIAELSIIDGASLYDLLENKASDRNFLVISNDEMDLEQSNRYELASGTSTTAPSTSYSNFLLLSRMMQPSRQPQAADYPSKFGLYDGYSGNTDPTYAEIDPKSIEDDADGG
jgi:hypothetical protein